MLSLGLSNTSLSGTLPTEVGLLASLAGLSIANTEISGFIPSELGGLGLELRATFMLSGNRLSGTIPSHLGQLSNLQSRLHLAENRLSGTIPTHLGALSKITIPELHSNSLSGFIPSEFGLVARLAAPAFAYNALSGTVHPSLSNRLKGGGGNDEGLDTTWTLFSQLDLETNAGISGSVHYGRARHRRMLDRVTSTWWEPWSHCAVETRDGYRSDRCANYPSPLAQEPLGHWHVPPRDPGEAPHASAYSSS
jgi:hypothetical protein